MPGDLVLVGSLFLSGYVRVVFCNGGHFSLSSGQCPFLTCFLGWKSIA